MKKTFYYLHLHAVDIYMDEKNTIILNSLNSDSLFESNGFWAFDDFPMNILQRQFPEVSFEKTDNVLPSVNLKETENIQIRSFPKFLYSLTIHGTPGVDDFGLYENKYLVVSQKALAFLRNTNIHIAESDEILDDVEAYFGQNKHYFWMPEPLRKKFIGRFT